MPNAPGQLKIADLERSSGVGRSTLHHYLNLGLLPRPRVLGPKLHVFSELHLERVREIQRLREQGWSLPRIRARLARMTSTPRKSKAPGELPAGTRKHIIEHATQLFAERGYQGVRMSDLASALGLGKATLYRHYPNKQALFVDCVEHVRFMLFPKELRARVDEKGSLADQGRDRAAAVLKNFTTYRTLTHLLGAVAHGSGSDPELAERAKVELHAMITNAEPYLRKVIGQSSMPARNAELLSYMLWGALLGAGERLALDDEFTLDQVLGSYLELAWSGLVGARSRVTSRRRGRAK